MTNLWTVLYSQTATQKLPDSLGTLYYHAYPPPIRVQDHLFASAVTLAQVTDVLDAIGSGV